MPPTPARIAILDDDEDTRILLGDRLQAEGHEVLSAAPIEAGLARLADGDPEIVFLGLEMELGQADEALAQIAAHPSPPTVIVVASYGGSQRAMEAIRSGAYDFVTKPVEPGRLRIAVNKAVERERLRRENAALAVRPRPSAPTTDEPKTDIT